MRKKSGFTIVEQVIVLVPEFENVVRQRSGNKLRAIEEAYRNGPMCMSGV